MNSALARTGLLASSSLLLCCVLPRAAHAQLPDLVELSVQYMPGVPLPEPRPAKAQITSYDAGINFPIQLGQTRFLIPGLLYHVESVSFENAPPSIQLRGFHSLELPLLFVQLLPRDWALSFRIAPGLAGDFRGFDSGLFRLGALVLATHTFSERFVFGFGALASYAFGTLLPLPALYFEWTPARRFRIEGFVPAFVQAKYLFWDRLELGARAEINGNAYAIREPRVVDAWPCAADDRAPQRAQCFDHVAYSVATAGVVASVRLLETLWLSVYGGHSLYRRMEQMNDADDRIEGGVQDLPNQFFLRTGLSWRIPRS